MPWGSNNYNVILKANGKQIGFNLKWQVLYLLNFSVCWNGPLCVSLVSEPRADRLQGSIGTTPAIVIYPILHIMMISVDALDHRYL